MDLSEIRKLAEMFGELGLGKLELEEDGLRIVLEAKSAPAPVYAAAPAYAPAPAAAPAATAPAPAAAPAPDKNLRVMTSPIVGTVYLTPQSGSEPYVQIGDRVSRGDTLCILESMKMFNELGAEFSGTVAEICVENGQVVEYGQRLFVLRVEGEADAT
jgi:acetyl-CoA carboxylase biotin carboxyl carrier protein